MNGRYNVKTNRNEKKKGRENGQGNIDCIRLKRTCEYVCERIFKRKKEK